MGARLRQASEAALILVSTAIQPLRAQSMVAEGGGDRVVATVTVRVPAFFRVEVDPGATDPGGAPKLRVVTNVPALRRELGRDAVVDTKVVRFTVTAP